MTQYSAIKIFEEKKIRTSWDAESETWYYSIVDVVGILTCQPDTRHASNYWKVLKSRLAKEGCELVTDCNQLKMPGADGKNYKTDVADAELLLRIIQSIPSSKAEPFKRWLRFAPENAVLVNLSVQRRKIMNTPFNFSSFIMV